MWNSGDSTLGIVIALVVVVVIYIVKGSKRRAMWAKIPGPKGKLLTGNFHELITADTGECQLQWVKQFGSVLQFRRLHSTRILITDPQAVKHVLMNSHSFTKENPLYNIIKGMIGDGILTQSDEDLHKKHRDIMTPAFAYRHIKALVPIFSQKGGILVSQWLKRKPTDLVNVRVDLSKATSDVIGEAAFSYTLGSQQAAAGGSVYELFSSLLGGNITVLNALPYIRNITPAGFRRRTAARLLDNVVSKIFDNKLDRINHKIDEGTYDILDLLMKCKTETGETFSRRELLANTKTFLLAGYETSSTSLLWTMYALSLHPDIQEKLAAEVIEFLGKDGIPTEEHVERMPYLDMVVKESLRWRPPIPMVIRTVGEDCTLAGYEIPKGATLTLYPYLQHHDPRYWEKPDDFIPDRWKTVPEDIMFSGSYIPFLLGPRNCIGSKFALLEIKVILSMIVQKVKFGFPPGEVPKIKRTARVTMTPKPDILLCVSPRV